MLVDRIKEDLKSALKSGDKVRTGVLRYLSAELYNRAKEKKAKGEEQVISDEEAIETIQKEFKHRSDAIELFRKGGRNDLVEKEKLELEIIEKYLPEAAGSEEIEKVVQAVISEGHKDFGSVMREAMKKLKGRADGKKVGETVKE
ncbi:MAG: GatB/YqeY domain-containing protein, partial [bacterium]